MQLCSHFRHWLRADVHKSSTHADVERLGLRVRASALWIPVSEPVSWGGGH